MIPYQSKVSLTPPSVKVGEQGIREKVERAQEDLLKAVLLIFKENPNQSFGPAAITKAAGLFKGLNEGGQNDRLSQGLINELVNRGQITKTDEGYILKAPGK